MVKPTDQEVIAVEKTVCDTHSSQEKGAHHGMGALTRKHTGWSGSRPGEKEAVTRDFIVVSMERNKRQPRLVEDCLV